VELKQGAKIRFNGGLTILKQEKKIISKKRGNWLGTGKTSMVDALIDECF
jgi:hypothetical protein